MSLLHPTSFPNGEQEIIDFSYERPVGVSILAVLLFLSGGITLTIELIHSETLAALSGMLGVAELLFMSVLYLQAVLGIAAGVGMWFGKQWGWYFAVFYLAYGILRNGNAILSIPGVAEAFEAGQAKEVSLYVKYGVRALGEAAILIYLLKESPLIYFCLPDTMGFRLKSIGITFGMGMLIFVLFRWLHGGY